MDWLNSLAELRNRYEADVTQVKNNEDLKERVKAERIKELTEEFERSYIEEKRKTEAALERTGRALYQKAHASEEGAGDIQADLLREMRRQRIERDLLDKWETRGDGPTVEEYEEALLRGNEDELAVYESYGPRRVRDQDQRQAVVERIERGRRERMTPERRRALEELKSFEKERDHAEYAMALQDQLARTMISRTKSLAPAGPPNPRRARR